MLCSECVSDLLLPVPSHPSKFVLPSNELRSHRLFGRSIVHSSIHFGLGPPREGKSSVSFTFSDFA
jgi:hypothetical protein